MNSSSGMPIVVGVNGTPESDRAVRYAARRADRTGCGLHLVNAAHEMVPVSPLWPLLKGGSVMLISRGVLDDARDIVTDTVGGRVQVAIHSSLGPAVAVLVSAGAAAHLVVLGHRGGGIASGLFTGATTLGVAARATCPVVSVPRQWVETTLTPRIVAAVDGSEASRAVLAYAFAMASERAGHLEVVHCWELSSAYSCLDAFAPVRQEWVARASAVLNRLVDGWRTLYPEVDLSTHLEYDSAARTLIRYSAGAEALFVGRHGEGGLGSRITMSAPGSTARILIEHAQCPLELVPMLLTRPPVTRLSAGKQPAQQDAPVRRHRQLRQP